MKIEIQKSNGGTLCRNETCQKLEEFVSPKGRIKSGTLCVVVQIKAAAGWVTAYYCKACWNDIYLKMKSVLDPKLRILK